MGSVAPYGSGLDQWRALSAESCYQGLPPLARLVQAVRDQSNSAEELLEQAFSLCEANLQIGQHEYATWQGLCVIDATGVFSAQGLGGDLFNIYAYDFWTFLRAMANLAQQSHDPAQYHQCINHNLFSSPAGDEVVLERLRAMEKWPNLRCRGCMVDTGKLLNNLVTTHTSDEKNTSNDANSTQRKHEQRQLLITPRLTPQAFIGYGRSLKLAMDGDVVVRGPYCLNVQLERHFYWLVGIQLEADWLINSTLRLEYQLEVQQDFSGPLRLLAASTAAEPQDAGRGERHFWLHKEELPHDARSSITVSMDESQWLGLNGHPKEAYGLKCSAASPALINQLPVQLIISLEAQASMPTPTGQLTLPTLMAVAIDSDLR